jgi:transcriptional regulator with XRE-family HTH domain
MRIFQGPEVDVTIPASPRAKRLPQGSPRPVPLRQVRRELNQSLDEVARKAALTETEIVELEAHQLPALEHLAAYARALGGELEVSISFGKKIYPLNLDPGAAPASSADLAAGWGDLDDPFPENLGRAHPKGAQK